MSSLVPVQCEKTKEISKERSGTFCYININIKLTILVGMMYTAPSSQRGTFWVVNILVGTETTTFHKVTSPANLSTKADVIYKRTGALNIQQKLHYLSSSRILMTFSVPQHRAPTTNNHPLEPHTSGLWEGQMYTVLTPILCKIDRIILTTTLTPKRQSSLIFLTH